METNKQWKRVPFDIELAKKIQSGEVEGRIVTRNGNDVRIICFDRNSLVFPIVALVQQFVISHAGENTVSYTIRGDEKLRIESTNDLFIELPEETPKHEFKPFDKVLVLNRDNKDDKWSCDIFSHKEGNTYILLSGSYTGFDIIPYEGNEHLVGTTNNPY